MRIVARSVIDTAPLETHRVSMRNWLVGLIAWLLETLGFTSVQRDIDAELRQTTRELRALLVAHAFARLRPHKLVANAPRAHHRAHRLTPGAFIRKCTSPVLKHLHRGSISQRAERLRQLIDNLDPLIDAVFAHMSAMFARPRVAGPQIRVARSTALNSVALTPLGADTS